MKENNKSVALKTLFWSGFFVGLTLFHTDHAMAGLASEMKVANDFIFGDVSKGVLAVGTVVGGGAAVAGGKIMLAGAVALTGITIGIVLNLLKDGNLSIGTGATS